MSDELVVEEPSGYLVGRSYTHARKYPWVIGKIQGWAIPFGPYTIPQLAVLFLSAYIVIRTFGLWSKLGPLSVIVLAIPFVATWAARHAKIDGRKPAQALVGMLTLLLEPASGRIGGRLARDPSPERFTGRIGYSAPSRTASKAAKRHHAVQGKPARERPRVRRARSARPIPSPPAAKLAAAQRAGAKPLRAGSPPPGPPRSARPSVPSPNPSRPAPTGLQSLIKATEAQNRRSE